MVQEVAIPQSMLPESITSIGLMVELTLDLHQGGVDCGIKMSFAYYTSG